MGERSPRLCSKRERQLRRGHLRCSFSMLLLQGTALATETRLPPPQRHIGGSETRSSPGSDTVLRASAVRAASRGPAITHRGPGEGAEVAPEASRRQPGLPRRPQPRQLLKCPKRAVWPLVTGRPLTTRQSAPWEKLNPKEKNCNNVHAYLCICTQISGTPQTGGSQQFKGYTTRHLTGSRLRPLPSFRAVSRRPAGSRQRRPTQARRATQLPSVTIVSAAPRKPDWYSRGTVTPDARV